MTTDPRRTVFLAGSLRVALAQALAECLPAGAGESVALVPGPSGILRSRILAGERPGLFVSANREHALVVARTGDYGPAVDLCGNRVCLLLAPGVAAEADPLALLLDPTLSLGTSTPGADPGGDYAWEVFDRAEELLPGSREALRGKAQTLVGGPGQAPPRPGDHPVAALLRWGRVKLFLCYHTTARLVLDLVPGTRVVELPPELAVRAVYALTLRRSAVPEPAELAGFLLGARGQALLADHGFSPPPQA